MNPLRAFRSWPRAIRLALFGVFCAALWIPILHTWWRGPWGDPVPNARHWEWPVSTAAAEGFDPGKLASLVKLLAEGERTPHLQALLIIRHGRLVTEEYFHGWAPDRLHTLQSVTKSFTSALVGIALARGEFRDVDERVLDYLPKGGEYALRCRHSRSDHESVE